MSFLKPPLRAATILSGLVFSCVAMNSNAAETEEAILRVCADPNNLPFSNRREEGFENRIAEIIAEELDRELQYFWWAQRRGFIRNTLRAGACDLVMGVPAGYEMAATTRPYYRSTYVWVYQQAREYDLHAMTDPRLADLRVGVHLIGDDGNNPPPVHALGAQGIVDNVTGYLIYGDYREDSPPALLIEAVANNDVDIAAVWGPLAGYYAMRAAVPLTVRPITDVEQFTHLSFDFAIAMGLRRGETEFQETIQSVLDRRQPEITAVLEQYGVPLLKQTEVASHDAP